MKYNITQYHRYLKQFLIFILVVIFFMILLNQESPSPEYEIVNFHEHIESAKEAQDFLQIMDEKDIAKTILLGSPNYTIYLDPKMGFEEYEKNNQEILKIAKQYPGRFIPFVTLNPLDENNLEIFKGYISQGAKGLKLYYGLGESHGKGPFHVMPLDDPRMDPVFEYLQANNIPVVFHVNLNQYYSEFVSLMEKFPKLKIIVPHFMISMWNEERLSRMENLFSKYPNLYTDISFGRPKFLADGFLRISENPELYRNFIIKNRERFLFGTDIVITKEKFRSKFPLDMTIQAYRDLLEKRRFRIPFSNNYLNGLYLDEDTLKIIYEMNPAKILGN